MGNTWKAQHRYIRPPVHPHARGEHLHRFCGQQIPVGSSPRSWGTRWQAMSSITYTRFIPTLVGNTARCCARSIASSVHPHARGEHELTNAGALTERGSSPRSWGTPAAVRAHHQCVRFIPTLVGNTFIGPPSIGCNAVHPHARGEHRCRNWRALSSNGSSPRSWGTLRADDFAVRIARFIPTLVGNT